MHSETNDAIQVLNERFKARMFSFSSDARRVSGTEELSFKGSRSRIGRALGHAAEELAGLPLAGLVLLTDGAATPGDQLSDVLLELRSSGVKVFPVPIGQKRFSRDVEVSRVDAPRSVLRGSSLQAEVTLAQTGFNGEKVVLEIEDEGRLVSSQEVSLPADGEALVVTTTFAAETSGTRRFSFRVVSGGGELLEENNRREVLIEA